MIISRLWKFLFFICVVAIIIILTFYFSSTTRRKFKSVYYKITSSLSDSNATIKLDVPYHKQEHALSCEIASLKMALNFYDIEISESELLAQLPYDTKTSRSKENVWGDPDKGFVGNIDGTIPNNGYGVYEDPIVELGKKYRDTEKIKDASLRDILIEVSDKHPVIVWGTLASGRDISWKTKDGKSIKAIYGEHARVIIGFTGTLENPKNIILHDPVYGTITMSKDKFLKNWGLLGNKAVVVY